MGVIESWLSSVYVLLRGRSKTETRLTKNEFTHRHSLDKSDGNEHYVLLMCHQFEHTVRFENWFIPDRNFYTYKVEVVYIKGVDDYKELPVGYYPHMCPFWLRRTTYPHHCAVNAYIDNLVFGEQIHARNVLNP